MSHAAAMADDGGGGGCARCCCSFIFTSGLTALFLWLSLRTYKPSLFIQDLYVHALNITDNSTAARNNHYISFALKLKNEMKDKSVYYDNISISFFYNSTILVANYTVPEFHQGHGKTAHRRESAEASGLPWAAAFAAVSQGSNVSFRVKAATRVRYKIMLWFEKRHSLAVAADVAVDDSGRKIKKKKDIKLKSAGPHKRCAWVGVGPVAIFTFFVIFVF